MNYYVIFKKVSAVKRSSSFHMWYFAKRYKIGQTYSLTDALAYLEKFDSMVMQHKILTEEINKNPPGEKYYVGYFSEIMPILCSQDDRDEVFSMSFENAVLTVSDYIEKRYDARKFLILKELE